MIVDLLSNNYATINIASAIFPERFAKSHTFPNKSIYLLINLQVRYG